MSVVLVAQRVHYAGTRQLVSRVRVTSLLHVQALHTGGGYDVPFRRCSAASRIAVVSGNHYGQILPASHSHILNAGELLPGISVRDLASRRHSLVQTLNDNAPAAVTRHVVAMASAPQLHTAPDVPCEYRQCTDYRYLCGFEEASSVLVMEWGKNDDKPVTTLFAEPRNEKFRLWHGPRTSLENIPAVYGVERALPIDAMRAYLSENYGSGKRSDCMHWYSASSSHDNDLYAKVAKQLDDIPFRSNVLPHLHAQRVVKSTPELQLMRQAAMATESGFLNMMRACNHGDGVSEWTLNSRLSAGMLESSVGRTSRVGLSFPSVVAGGARATVLHYLAKDMFIERDEMVLVDAGAEVHGYVSDVSRTWPVSGTYTATQRALYEAVLDVQSHAMESINTAAASGQAMSINKLHSLSLGRMRGNLRDIGVMPSNLSLNDSHTVTRQLFPHALCHYVGGDVHDCKYVSGDYQLKQGVAFTIEPGLYIPADTAPSCVPSRFHGIGIRIEDIVVIDSHGNAELITNLLKTVDAIEHHLNTSTHADSEMEPKH